MQLNGYMQEAENIREEAELQALYEAANLHQATVLALKGSDTLFGAYLEKTQAQAIDALRLLVMVDPEKVDNVRELQAIIKIFYGAVDFAQANIEMGEDAEAQLGEQEEEYDLSPVFAERDEPEQDATD